jgi:hypothetical protein
MGCDVEIPNAYTITLAGGADLDLDNIRIKELPRIEIGVKELPRVEIGLKEFPPTPLKTDSTIDMGLDNIRIKELPTVKLDADIGIKPTRVHMPMNMQFCLSLLGINLMRFSLCGENMIITEPYVARNAEECK